MGWNSAQLLTAEDLERERARIKRAEERNRFKVEQSQEEVERFWQMVDYLVYKFPPRRLAPHRGAFWAVADVGELGYLEIAFNLGYFDPRASHPQYRPPLDVPVRYPERQPGTIQASREPIGKESILKQQKQWRKRNASNG